MLGGISRYPLNQQLMGLEIERKFLVKGDFRPFASQCIHMVQAYLCSDEQKTVRIRLLDETAFLTIKGSSTDKGLSRYEFEQSIPYKEALALLELCQNGRIEKQRWLVPIGDICFEVDVFEGENKGLIVAEIELEHATQSFVRPEWLGEEVTGQAQYYNAALSQCPYCQWSQPTPSKDTALIEE